VAYAQALLDLANEANQADSIAQELRAIRQIIDTNDEFAQVLADPAIGGQERGELMNKLFAGRASDLMMKFLGLVNEKDRLGELAGIAGAYDDLIERQHGNIVVDVTVAHKLSDDQLENVRRTISETLKRNAVVQQFVDDSIIGGVVLRVQDQLIDGSVRAQLSAMRRKILIAREELVNATLNF
jgi:F-type H+-transporting ATPase subunit delta